MSQQFLTLLVGALAALGTLIVAGVFIRRGTAIKGIEVMDKVIAAYGIAEKLEERKMAALSEQLTATQLERESLAVQLTAANLRVADLERATGTWVLERTTMIHKIATLESQNAGQEKRIAQLEATIPKP